MAVHTFDRERLLPVDPEGIYIDAYTKADDGFAVLDHISDRLVDLLVEEGVGLYVVPLPKEET
jgi:hypothetical protein